MASDKIDQIMTCKGISSSYIVDKSTKGCNFCICLFHGILPTCIDRAYHIKSLRGQATKSSSSSPLGSHSIPKLGEYLSMPSPVFVQVVSPSLGWSPLSSFHVVWPPNTCGNTKLEELNCQSFETSIVASNKCRSI